MTGRAVVQEGSCPSVQNGRADVREGRIMHSYKIYN